MSTPAPAAAGTTRLSTGTVIDERFVVREFLGAGGFGDVYRAEQLLFGRGVRDVALKVFKAERVTAQNAAAVFNDGITLFSLMEDDPPPEVSRRMVQVYDIGVTRVPFERGYIAMRLIDGRRSLARELRRFEAHGMPVQATLWYLWRLLVPLAWLHQRTEPLVHGDLKPENVLLTDQHDIVLTDFGLAARLPLGAAGGTVAYDAPEVLLQGVGLPAADIYSLGVIWYEMLAGRHPFADVGLEALAAGDPVAYRRAHHDARLRPLARAAAPDRDDPAVLPSPARWNPALREHPQIDALLAKCMAERAPDRFHNARLLLDEVERYAKTGVIKEDWLEPSAMSAASPVAPSAAPDAAAPAKSPAARAADALALIAQGDPRRALAMLQDVLAAQSDFAPALAAQCKAHLALGDVEAAHRAIGPAYLGAPNDAVLMAAYADVLEASGQRQLAQALRQKAELERARAHVNPQRSAR